jgi:DNA-binding NarL/FixJ family response regulator
VWHSFCDTTVCFARRQKETNQMSNMIMENWTPIMMEPFSGPNQAARRCDSGLRRSGGVKLKRRRVHHQMLKKIGREGNRRKPDTERGRKRILIVDDQQGVRDRLTTLINQQSDLKVCGEARNAEEALKLIATSKPHVAIVDVSMERGSRIKMIKNILATCPDLAVIVLSIRDRMICGEQPIRTRTRSHVLKREVTENVLHAIRCVIDGKLCLINEMTRMLAGKFWEDEPFAPGFPADLITDQQFEVFQLLGRGYSNTQVAQELRVSVNTVRGFCAGIKQRLKLSNARELLSEAVRWYQRQGLKSSRFGGKGTPLAGAHIDLQERTPTNNGFHSVHFAKTARSTTMENVESGSAFAGSMVELLSNRELEVFRLLGCGCNNQQIAKEMRITFKTVHSFRGRIKEKLKLSSATEVPRAAWRWHEQQNSH